MATRLEYYSLWRYPILALLDSWLWFIFLGAGVLTVIVSLYIGIRSSLYLASIGFAFMLGGVTAWSFQSWVHTVVITGILCLACVLCFACFVLFRRYIVKRSKVSDFKEIDGLIGIHGTVTKEIVKGHSGLVEIGDEVWKAGASELIAKGEEVIVTGRIGTTLLIVKRIEVSE
jgi:membrane protein implicated in regulation of membrane protease activity